MQLELLKQVKPWVMKAQVKTKFLTMGVNEETANKI
jgi:hypothetical protein